MVARLLTVAIFALDALLGSWGRSAAYAASAPPLQTETVSHGIKLSFRLPRRAYPGGALVKGVVEAQNVSRHRIKATDDCWGGDYFTLGLLVLDSPERVVYPPAFANPPLYLCRPQHVVQVLRPGQRMRSTVLAVLRGPVVEATLSLEVDRKRLTEHPTVTAGPVTVQLLPADPPTARIVPSPTGAYVQMQRPAGVTSLLYYQYWAACPEPDGVGLDRTTRWLTDGDSFLPAFPECPGAQEWHAVAGWLNEPVADIDFVPQ